LVLVLFYKKTGPFDVIAGSFLVRRFFARFFAQEADSSLLAARTPILLGRWRRDKVPESMSLQQVIHDTVQASGGSSLPGIVKTDDLDDFELVLGRELAELQHHPMKRLGRVAGNRRTPSSRLVHGLPPPVVTRSFSTLELLHVVLVLVYDPGSLSPAIQSTTLPQLYDSAAVDVGRCLVIGQALGAYALLAQESASLSVV